MRCVVLAVVVLGLAGAEATERPVVGVLAQELPQELLPKFPDKHSFIPASYVKAVEAAGARAAPIFINQSQEYYKSIVSSVNGVVLPGGGTNFTDPDGYADAGRSILAAAQKLQDSGVTFPVLGVCQGFELLMFLAINSSNPQDILVDCNATNSALSLVFDPDFQKSSLYNLASPEIITILKTLPVTSNHHRKCVTKERLRTNRLEKTWQVLSTNKDNHGLEFVSSSQHFQRPLVGVQFHPEKNMYEWNPRQANPHSRKAILSNRLFYDWLVAEARLNDQHFSSAQQEQDALIYNYIPVFSGRAGGYNEQIYLF